ncbi:MAG TPA: dihydroneopterin aldolase [Candidatus Stackebrandtia faecavium]|nr:dihydroneopterin aldolase [Candidatus Stackebrandtia faecavium]
MTDMGDQITLSGLQVHGYHGVYASEQASGQIFIVDVTLYLDVAVAAANDNVADTVHYGDLADALANSVANGPRVNLLETLAERLARVCLEHGPVHACDVTVHKPQAPIGHMFSDVSVTIHREKP